MYELEPWAANSIEQAVAIQTAALLMPHTKKGDRVKPDLFLPLKGKKEAPEVEIE